MEWQKIESLYEGRVKRVFIVPVEVIARNIASGRRAAAFAASAFRK